MDTMNIELPENLKEFVQHRVEQAGYSSVSEYMQELIRADQKRYVLEELEVEVLKGLASGPPTLMTEDDWQVIRAEVRQRYEARMKHP